MKRISGRKVLPTFASLLTLSVGLAALNDDIRAFVKRLLSGSAGAEIHEVAGRLQEAGMAVYLALRDQSIEHAPMTVFVVAASVLVFFMLRT